MGKLTRKREKELRDKINRFPTYSDHKIGEELGFYHTTVAKFRKEMALRRDSEFIAITAGKFIAVFQKAADYWLNQVTELEELKGKTKTIFKTNNEGVKFPEEVNLEPMDILAICKHQADLHKNILFLAGQGEVREVIRMMRTGKIPMLIQENNE